MSINIEKKSQYSDGYNVTCKRCGRKYLKWIHSDYTKSGWQLQEKDGRDHYCTSNPKITEYDKLVGDFYNNLVIWDSDTEEVKQKKMERQRKLLGVE